MKWWGEGERVVERETAGLLPHRSAPWPAPNKKRENPPERLYQNGQQAKGHRFFRTEPCLLIHLALTGSDQTEEVALFRGGAYRG